jgi:HTH-type transcriptional regulator/antitoxin HigA
MNVKPIRNETDYNTALARVDALWEAAPGSQEIDELEVLAVLIDNYEGSLGQASVQEPNPIRAIACFMEQHGL